MTKWQQK